MVIILNFKKVIFVAVLLFVIIIPSLSYAETNVDILIQNGIVFGDESGLRLNDNLKRCEFVAMINRTFEIVGGDNKTTFGDVSENDWYYNDFNIAAQNGYLKGSGNMEYNPQNAISRAEAVTLIGRLMGYSKAENTSFSDDYSIPEWAKGTAESLRDYGIVSGYPDGTFKPEKLITREEAFIILSNVISKRFSGGDGSAENPYIITKPYQLFNIKYDMDACYSLKSDILFKDIQFSFSAIGSETNPFSGSFNGNEHKITGLYTTDSSKNALFDTIGENGVVFGVKIVCPETFFSVCVTNNGRIKSCANTSFTGSVQHQFKKTKGGICGVNNGDISECYNTSDVLSRTNDDYMGGIVGENNGTISKCFNLGTVKSDYASGIAGKNNGRIEDSYSAGDIIGKNAKPVTDSVGKGVENCAYTGQIVTNIGTLASKKSLVKMFSGNGYILDKETGVPVLESISFSGNEDFTMFSGGDGSENNPYIISDADEFSSIAEFPDRHFRQSADIDISKAVNLKINKIIFNGTYDGMGHKLSGFQTVFLNTSGSLLFAENNGVIKNLNISDCYAEGKTVSVIAVKNHGIIEGCNITAVLKGESASGIVTENYGEIKGCSFDGKITSGKTAGGLCLFNYSKIENCLSLAHMYGNSAAGVVYENAGRIDKSCFFGVMNSSIAAGISYFNSADIKDCYYAPGCVSTYDNKGRISAVTRDKNQILVQGSFSQLDFENNWKMISDIGPVPTSFLYSDREKENTVDFAGGNGNVENPFKLVTPNHIDNIRKYPDASFILMNNIDMSEACLQSGMFFNNGKGFTPIDNFSGILFGNGFKISGLYQNTSAGGFINQNYGVITSLTVAADIAADNAGIVVNENNGTILFCSAEGTLNVFKGGGISVENSGIISECVNKAEICASSLGAGLSAHNRNEILNCLNLGEISGSGDACVILGIGGGGKIEKCFNSADLYFISAEGEFYPVSDTSYNDCYYIDRYNKKFKGALTFIQLFDYKSFQGFDFINVWGFTSKGLPTLVSAGSPDITLNGVFSGGKGTSEEPYIISTAEEFYNIRMYKDSYFKLASDINLTGVLSGEGLINNAGKGFEPIDTFYGSINGNGCTVYGLTYVNEHAENAGLFGVLRGSIYNISFAECRIEGLNNAGVVAGVNYGKISNVNVRNSRIGTYDGASGGIAGVNKSEITNCVNTADVFSQKFSGGIAGENYAYISMSSNRGGVLTTTQTYDSASGGITGKNSGNVSSCYNIGKVLSYSESDSAFAGGISGVNEKNILNCYNTGTYNAKGKQCMAGGITGYSLGTGRIEHTFNSGYGNISGDGYLGALAGYGDGEISFSYYEHTLPSAAFGNIKMYDIYPISTQMLLSVNGTEFLSSEIWTKNENTHPQITGNEHRENERVHNVRDFAGGDGSMENPYIIMTPEQLDNVRRYLGSAFMLIGDIDMTSYCSKNGFEPIGDNVFGFFGTFMGNGYRIKGLEIKGSSLFKQNHGEIYNLIIDNMSVISSDKLCGIAEVNTGLIYQCDTHTDFYADNGENFFFGGVAGVNLRCGMIISSFAYGNMNTASQTVQAGGICYGNYGVIAGCHGEVNIETTTRNLGIAGGICAYNYGTVSDCSSVSGTVVYSEKNASAISGGIAGVSGGNIVSSYSSSDMIKGETTGGICGNPSNGTIINCYYNELVSGDNVSGAYPCSADDLHKQETFAGFDFYSMWYMPETGTPEHIR